MSATANQISVAASALSGISDKLGAIIYLLNTTNMSANDISKGAASYGANVIQDQFGAIIYLLANGGAGGGGVTNGTVDPSAASTAGALYLNTTSNTLWVYNNGWKNLV